MLVDDPCYFNFQALLRAHRAKSSACPTRRPDPILALFAEVLAAHRPRLYITNSALHNPTGATLSPQTAHRLLNAAAAHDLTIVEDDIFADFEPEPSPRLAALDGLSSRDPDRQLLQDPVGLDPLRLHRGAGRLDRGPGRPSGRDQLRRAEPGRRRAGRRRLERRQRPMDCLVFQRSTWPFVPYHRVTAEAAMQIRIGYEIMYDCPQPTPMLLLLRVHPTREADLLSPDEVITQPRVPVQSYIDGFGNHCSRITAPPGRITLSTEAIINDSSQPDLVVPHAAQVDVRHLPPEHLVFLLGSRYCETDELTETAWSLFGTRRSAGRGCRRSAISCTTTSIRLHGGAPRPKSAGDVYKEKTGVCRRLRPSRRHLLPLHEHPGALCTGYLGDIGVPEDPEPMDFSAWFEAYLDNHWYTFDARHNVPRIGRILIGRGRDAADVPSPTASA